MNKPPADPAQGTLARALAGYDSAFKDRLKEAIAETIMHESLIEEDGQKVFMLRLGETTDALVTALIATLSMSEAMDVPSRLREEVENICKRVRRGVAKARADGVFDCFGAARGGHA